MKKFYKTTQYTPAVGSVSSDEQDAEYCGFVSTLSLVQPVLIATPQNFPSLRSEDLL